MVKFSYQPWSEIVIHEIIEYEADALFAMIVKEGLASTGVGMPPSINWVDGIAFDITPFPETDETVAEKLKGIVHYSSVEFALVPQYKPEIQVNVGGSLHPIRVEKVDMNPTFRELAAYLKRQSK